MDMVIIIIIKIIIIIIKIIIMIIVMAAMVENKTEKSYGINAQMQHRKIIE